MMVDAGAGTGNEGAFFLTAVLRLRGFHANVANKTLNLYQRNRKATYLKPRRLESCNAAKEVLLCLCSWALFGRQCHVDRSAEVG